MIKKLKKRFILLATVSTAVLMTILIMIMNITNLSAVIKESDGTLEVLNEVESRVEIDKPNKPDIPEEKELKAEQNKDFIPRGMSPETPYESRYFTASVNKNGDIEETNFSKIISVEENQAQEYVDKAISKSHDKGFIGQFRYLRITDEEHTKILFLDCGRRIDAFYTFMWISISIAVLGCLIVFVLFLFVAPRIIRPISESYEKQKRFITDASHEIKTPLTIIGANVDLLELDIGENESLSDIKSQTNRLTNLTKDLVYLTKMEETDDSLPKVNFPLSDLISETAQQFRGIANAQKKNYEYDIQPDIEMNGYPDEIRKLTSILLDNAMKYSPENGMVKINLFNQKRTINLTVKNTATENIDKESISKVFDRFYRMDLSRNSQTGGHGIGLSIAKAIVESNNGKITASTTDGKDFCISVIFIL